VLFGLTRQRMLIHFAARVTAFAYPHHFTYIGKCVVPRQAL
jgi:hypothetical protein